jgi:antitoxin component of MazEF toxin-antitoxin module
MWVRVIGKTGNSVTLVLPSDALDALKWERGDFLAIKMSSKEELVISKFDPARISRQSSGKEK